MNAPGGHRRRNAVRAFVELFALSGLAITQPVLDVFGRAPDQFILRGADRSRIVLFAVIVAVGPATVAWLLEALVGAVSRPARRVLHLVFLGLLAAGFLTLAADLVLPRPIALGVGLLVGVAFAAAYDRSRAPGIWLGFLTPAPIVFTALFLLSSSVAPLLRGPVGALGTPVRSPAPTVVVVLDELPLASLLDVDGDIDADLFPNFARLADTSHWFRRATTVSNYTWLALPALLTGAEPAGGTVPDSSSHPRSLFTLVGGAMPVTSSEVVTRLCPASICATDDPVRGGLPALLADAGDVLWQQLSPTATDRDPTTGPVEDRFDEPAPVEGEDEFHHFAAVDDRFGRFVDRLGRSEPGLEFLHLLLPHIPYRHLADGTRYDGPDPDLGRHDDRWADDPALVDLGRQRHLLQLQWTDQLLGRIIDRLQETDRWDDTNVVVVSDHGSAFRPGGHIRAIDPSTDPEPADLAQIAHVPFFVKTAGQAQGFVSDHPVRTVDLLPTIADLLDVDIPWTIDGRSAFDGGSGDPDRIELSLTRIGDRGVGPGRTATIGRSESEALLLRAAAGRFAPTADGTSGDERIHRVGPRPDLWAAPLPDGLRALDVVIDDASALDGLDPVADRLPALFRARVRDAPVGTPAAIAVNGTVWATVPVHDDGDGPRIAAILPRRAFETGVDELAVYELP